MSTHLYTNIHDSVIPNSQNVGTSQISITGEWINKMWHVHTVEYLATKREEILVHG